MQGPKLLCYPLATPHPIVDILLRLGLWHLEGLPWWLNSKEFTCNAGDTGSLLGLGRFPGEGDGNLLQLFLPEKSHEERTLAD